MTGKEQTNYWRKYAKQNAKMERLAYRIMVRGISEALKPVLAALEEYGVERTITDLDGIFSKREIQLSFERLYYQVGVAQKKWTDVDIKSRIPQKKGLLLKEDEDERWSPRRLFNFLNPEPKPTVTPNIELGFFNAKWLARLKQIATGLDVAERVTSVSDTIKKRVRDSLIQAQQEFVSIKKITARLRQDVGGKFTRRRAETIARTEVTHIANIAAEESAMETGLDLVKVWIHTRDDRTRDAHRNVSKKPIKADQKFMVGGVAMSKPGDPAGGKANVINCRCSVAYLPADDYEDLLDESGEFNA